MTKEEADKIIFTDLGMCGCGDPDAVLEWVRDALAIIRRRDHDLALAEWESVCKHITEFMGSGVEFWIKWYFLDRAGLIEHGGNVSGSWITGKGDEFLQYLQEHPTLE